jgi:hypothetical protein
MALTFRDYSADQVQAARSVLLELVHLLGEYRDDIVVVGGWVPQLILPPGPTLQVGSIDVDLALNHRNLRAADTQPSAIKLTGCRVAPSSVWRSICSGAEAHKAEQTISGPRFANESRFNAWQGLKVDAASLRAGGEPAEKGVYLR